MRANNTGPDQTAAKAGFIATKAHMSREARHAFYQLTGCNVLCVFFAVIFCQLEIRVMPENLTLNQALLVYQTRLS